MFWTNTQMHLWVDFYNNRECMKNGIVVMPKAINKETLSMHQATKYRFVVDTLKRMGLYVSGGRPRVGQRTEQLAQGRLARGKAG